jgi:hypothetical protein
MSRPLALLLLGIVSACALPRPAGEASARRWYHGTGFCIALAPDETIEREDTGSDFTLYHYRRGDEQVTIYEGGHPTPGGVIRQTGFGWPPLISIHGPRSFARRFLVGDRRRACG